MATDVTPDVRTSGGSSAGASSISWAHVTSAGLTNGFAGVEVTTGTGTAINVTSVTYDFGGTNLALANKIRDVETLGNCKAEIWGGALGATPASGSKTIKVVLPSSVEVTAGSITAQFVNQTTPYNAASGQSNKSNISTASLTVTSALHELVLVCLVENGGSTLTPGAGQTTIHNLNIGAGQHAGASSDKAGAASVATSYTGVVSGNTWVMVGVSLQFDGGGGGGGGFTPVSRRFFNGSIGRVGSRQAA